MASRRVAGAFALAQRSRRGTRKRIRPTHRQRWTPGDKLCVLLRWPFNAKCTPALLYRQGIRGIDARDLAYGRELGYVLKLLAVARRTDAGVEGRVHSSVRSGGASTARVDGRVQRGARAPPISAAR